MTMFSRDLLDDQAHLNSPVHRLDARVKLVAAAVLLAAMLVVPLDRNWLLLVHAGGLLVVAGLSHLPARWLLQRMAVLAPFLLLGTVAVAILPPVTPADALNLGPLTLSEQAFSVWASVGGKCALALLIAIILAGTSTTAGLLRAARSLHVPRTLTALTGFAITYLAVLADEAGRMITGMRCRGRIRGLARRLRIGASMMVTLMARTVERADRIALAMVSRGYRGTMPALDQPSVPASHLVAGAGTVAISALLIAVSFAP